MFAAMFSGVFAVISQPKSRFIRAGLALCLSAWLFGAVLLGAGNALLLQTALPTSQSVIASSNGHHGNHMVQHDATSPALEALPMHCMFCLDGLAATAVRQAISRSCLVASLSIKFTCDVSSVVMLAPAFQLPLSRAPPIFLRYQN